MLEDPGSEYKTQNFKLNEALELPLGRLHPCPQILFKAGKKYSTERSSSSLKVSSSALFTFLLGGIPVL